MTYNYYLGAKKEKGKIALFLIACTFALSLALAAVMPASAADSTVKVSGDTAAGENQPGWMFNRDASTSTPYEFNTDEASIGAGSLYVQPIGANPADKFIAEYFYLDEIANVNSISYDFKTDSTDDADQFYMNLYVNDGSNPAEFYDCRYNIVPSTLSPDPTTGFTTVTYNLDDPASSVTTRGTSNIVPCPATPADLPDGAVLRAIALNVGDTSANDVGLEGYLDKVVLDTTSGITTFDFDPAPQSKDECKKGGWADFGFSNQGQCIRYVNTGQDSR
jgi:hypothetical protein